MSNLASSVIPVLQSAEVLCMAMGFYDLIHLEPKDMINEAAKKKNNKFG
eukprot:CAMPEP_0116871906 /NCGR_PEP_ID=MMETSP0463-20121206/2462_1 /TAXON_ID=181622 /ORGANISM="Strombidinopsis sp, Strain SopsisLIS2011" /LENGTH=48 /DNA_ID= /DNA_START= /DNA_END= /DNA_ORIENTATION=